MANRVRNTRSINGEPGSCWIAVSGPGADLQYAFDALEHFFDAAVAQDARQDSLVGVEIESTQTVSHEHVLDIMIEAVAYDDDLDTISSGKICEILEVGIEFALPYKAGDLLLGSVYEGSLAFETVTR